MREIQGLGSTTPFFLIGFEDVSSSVGDKAGCERLGNWEKSQGMMRLVFNRFFTGADKQGSSLCELLWSQPESDRKREIEQVKCEVTGQVNFKLSGSFKEVMRIEVSMQWVESEQEVSQNRMPGRKEKLRKLLERNSQYHFYFFKEEGLLIISISMWMLEKKCFQCSKKFLSAV